MEDAPEKSTSKFGEIRKTVMRLSDDLVSVLEQVLVLGIVWAIAVRSGSASVMLVAFPAVLFWFLGLIFIAYDAAVDIVGISETPAPKFRFVRICATWVITAVLSICFIMLYYNVIEVLGRLQLS